MKNIDNAIGWKEFLRSFDEFTGKNNFTWEEHQMILHAMNSFYFMAYPLEVEIENEQNKI